MLKILGRPTSINVRKVLWVLDEAGIAYDHEPQWATPGASTKTPEYLALNPNALVPVIIEDDFVLWESNTICRYLAARAGREDLLPSGLRERAEVEKWMDWASTDINNAYRDAFMALIRKDSAYDDAGRVAASAKRWNAAMGILDSLLEKREHVAGETFTLADIVMALSTHRWRSTPIEHAALPAVDRWIARLAQRPECAAYCAPEYP